MSVAHASLRRLIRVEAGEVGALLWSFCCFFCILCGYYILRPLRDEGVQGGVENLPWLFSATFAGMLATVPLFGWAAAVARAFFVWVSVFNLFVVSVFWSLMTDIFRPAQAARLFGFISAGGSCGARDGDNRVSGLSIDGARVEYAKRDVYPGQRPYGIVICEPGNIAVVANVGAGQGDADTVSVIDMKAKPVRVVDTITVGSTPEGIACAPDGRKVAVTVMNGSNKPKDSPFYEQHGKVILLRVNGQKLHKVAEADVGNWPQGVAFSANGRTLLVQNMVQNDIQVFDVVAAGLHDTGRRINLRGGPAGIGIADKPR